MSFAALGRWASNALRHRQPWPPKSFTNPHFERFRAIDRIEEENFSEYSEAGYYPMRIGEMLGARYQVVGKLGYGRTSTVWLARDLPGRRHVAVKVFTQSDSMRGDVLRETAVHNRLMEQGPQSHPGRDCVRTLVDSFTVSGPHGVHRCLVHPPLWETLRTFLARNPIGRMPVAMLAWTLHRVFHALACAHKCQVIHTDISPYNILRAAFEAFEQAEVESPIPRKEFDDGTIIYLTRELEMHGSVGLPVLCDFGSAVWGNEVHQDFAQPRLYQAPEVILGIPWSYEIDIWNVGCVVWGMFEDGDLFSGHDSEHGEYRLRAHLAEMIALLGPPPPEFAVQGSRSARFFSEQGVFQAGIAIPPAVSLEQRETNLEGSDKKLFLQLMRKMLQWEPKKRYTASQLLEDEWVKKHTTG